MKKFYPFLLLCYLLNPLNSFAQKKYNVLFVIVDDLNIGFDSYGNPQVPSPNFDRLMKHGVMFQTAYCQYPLCTPSRTSMHSGKRPDETGVYDNFTNPRTELGKSYKFLPEYFDAYGYRTEAFGKAGICNYPNEITWDNVYKGEIGFIKGFKDNPDWWIDTLPKDISETKDRIITEEVVNKLRNPVATPFFYGLGLSTHNPFTPILDTWNKIGDPSKNELLPIDSAGTLTNVRGNGSGNIKLPDTPPNDTADIPPVALKEAKIFTPYETKQIRHGYYGETIEMDGNLGELLDEMDRSNLWDNTVVIFWSDHGLMLGEHQGQWLKLDLFEEDLRVPFVICAPGKLKNAISPALVEAVDIFPTLTELCGLPAPDDMEGSSLVPLLEKPNAEWKKAIFTQCARYHQVMGRTARTDKFQYNYWDGDGGEELYDLKNDPFEYTNLAKEPAHQDDLHKMQNILENGWQDALPPVYTISNYYKDEDGDGYGKTSDNVQAYFKPDGYVSKNGDCDDKNKDIHPGGTEVACNGKDDNCDNQIDETTPQPTIIVVGSLDICQTGLVLLKTEHYPGAAYQWKRDGHKIAGATSRTYTATQTGNYKVEVSNEECSSLSDKVTVTNSCSKIAGKLSSSELLTPGSAFSLYPNPSTGIVTVTYISPSAGSINLLIYDKVGKILFRKTDNAVAGSNSYQLHLSNLKPGTYEMELNNGISPQRTKLVIER